MSDNADPQRTIQPTGRIDVRIFGRHFAISRFTYLLVLGAVVGALTGLVTVIFRAAALLGHEYIFPYQYDDGALQLLPPGGTKRVLMPMFSGLICGVLLFKVGKFTGTHAISTILRAIASGRSHFKKRLAIPPALAVLTLTMGGSAGPEGPIAELGSLIGSTIGRWAQAPPRMMKTLIGSGVAAGIAAVFNAPIGGVFFAIEVILRNYEVASFTPIVVAAVAGSVVCNAFPGIADSALTIPSMTIHNIELPLYILLGLICGGISIGYIYGIEFCHNLFRRLPVPIWLRPAIGGLLVGMVGLFMPLIMGEGYAWMQDVINGTNPLTRILWLLLTLGVLKALATGLTLGSGNPGGSFAPAVFIGIMAGAAYGIIMQRMGLAHSAVPYAVMGMAGLIAGALGAPLTGIMIALGFGGQTSIDMLLALMTTVALCMFVMQFWKSVSVYTLEFVRLGIDLDHARGADPLSLVGVKSVMHASGFETLPSEMPVHEAMERMKDSTERWFVVRREKDNQFVGIVSLHEMRMAIAEEELSYLLVLGDITDSFQPRLLPEMSIKDALRGFNTSDAEVLPIFDGADPGARFLGVISRQDALNAYWEYSESIT